MTMSEPGDFEVGHEFEPIRHPPLTRVQIARFSGAVGDFNPVHLDEPFARSAGLPSVIAQGPLSLSQLAAALQSWVQPRRISVLRSEFRAMNPPGTEIICRGRVSAADEHGFECELVAETADGTVITSATATVEH